MTDLIEIDSNLDELETSSNSTAESEIDSKVPDVEDVKFTAKETIHFKTIDRFFKNLQSKKINKMLTIIDGKNRISLRLLDWFITRYADKYKTNYNVNGDRLSVHISYKAQLKSYKKRYFDPFRRRKKFMYNYDKKDKTKRLCTTIGQLNFFKWVFSYQILEHVEKNYNTLHDSMVETNKLDKIKKNEKKTKSKTVRVKKNGVKLKAKMNREDRRDSSIERTIILSFND